MLQSLVQLLVLASIFLSVQATFKLNYTRELQFETYNPTAIPIGSHIFLVSKYDSLIRVDSSDDDYQSCVVATDLGEEVIDAEKYKAVAVGTKKIIVWGFHNSVFNPNKTEGYRKYIILLIDLQNCSYQSLKNLEEKVPIDYPLVLPEIVVHQNYTFDVFLMVKPSCLPCRFDDEGRRIQIDRQIQSRPWSLRIQKLDPTDTYVVVEDKSVVKILDRDFKELKRINNIKFSFTDEFSVSSGSTNTRIGFVTNFDFSYVTLALFDSSLELIFTKLLYKSDNENYIGSNYLVIDSKGKSFITFESVEQVEKVVKHSIVIVDADAQLLSKFDLDVFQSECDHCWIYRPAFLLDDREYCVVNHYIPIGGYGYSKIKCLDVSGV